MNPTIAFGTIRKGTLGVGTLKEGSFHIVMHLHMHIIGLLLIELLITGATFIFVNTFVFLEMIVHRILFRRGKATMLAKILIVRIFKIAEDHFQRDVSGDTSFNFLD
jgi:hypothetical protein